MTSAMKVALARAALLCLSTAAWGGCQQAGRALPAEARPRVVSLHDVTTEIVLALGAADRLVGLDEPVDLDAAAKATVASRPRVGSLESILALRPTVVLGLAVTAERAPELVGFLRARGVEVWLGHPAQLTDVLALVTEVGARIGAAPAAAALVARLRGRMEAGPPPARPPLRVFVYDCCDPAFTAGAGAVLTDLIGRAGGRNVFADVAADWTKVSWEEVIARRPQLIVVHDYAYAGQGDVAQKRRRLAALRSLAGVPVTVMPLGYSLGGLRSFDGLEQLRKAIAGSAG
jgi:iron complex transport system substrate-binding protein